MCLTKYHALNMYLLN